MRHGMQGRGFQPQFRTPQGDVENLAAALIKHDDQDDLAQGQGFAASRRTLITMGRRVGCMSAARLSPLLQTRAGRQTAHDPGRTLQGPGRRLYPHHQGRLPYATARRWR